MKMLADTLNFDLRAKPDTGPPQRALLDGDTITFYRGTTVIATVPRAIFVLAAHTLVSEAENRADERLQAESGLYDRCTEMLTNAATMALSFPAWADDIEAFHDASRFGFAEIGMLCGEGPLDHSILTPWKQQVERQRASETAGDDNTPDLGGTVDSAGNVHSDADPGL